MTSSRMSWRISAWSSVSIACPDTSKVFVIGSACKIVGVDRNTLSCTPPDRTIRNHSRIGTPIVNEGVFSPSRGKISSFAKWTGNIEPLDTSDHVSATQERNSDLLGIEKVGVKSFRDKIVADLDQSIQVNLANSVLREIPKFKSLGLPTFDATYICNLDFAPSTRAKSLNGTQRDNFKYARLGYTHDFKRMCKTTAYRNHSDD